MRQVEGTPCSRLGAMGFSESDVISMLNNHFATSDPRVEVGIGDDAAVITGSPRQVITTDMAVESVHFKRQWSSAFDIGRKVTAANLADILAMGAKPDYLVVALSINAATELSWLEDLARGIAHEAKLGGAHVVGGDLTKGEAITISIAAVGSVHEPILRSGAKVGDSIYISALPGWSAAGLALLQNNQKAGTEIEKRAVKLFQAPSIDYAYNSSNANSLCDLSDALITQAEQIAKASKVELAFDPELFSDCDGFQELRELASQMNADVYQWIFAGGEDHVFLSTGTDLPGFKVGEVRSGEGVSGLVMKKAPDTWRHFN